MTEKREIAEVRLPKLELVSDEKNKQLCIDVFRFFESVPQGMTQYQIKNFVLCDMEFPTTPSKYWQCLLELWIRLQNVVSMHYDYRKRKARIKELEALEEEAIDKANDTGIKVTQRKRWSAVAEKHRVEIEENEFSMMCLAKGVSDKLKEMNAFNEVLDSCKEYAEMNNINISDKDLTEDEFWMAKAEWSPELKARFPEVFGVKSRQEYDRIKRKLKR